MKHLSLSHLLEPGTPTLLLLLTLFVDDVFLHESGEHFLVLLQFLLLLLLLSQVPLVSQVVLFNLIFDASALFMNNLVLLHFSYFVQFWVEMKLLFEFLDFGVVFHVAFFLNLKLQRLVQRCLFPLL